MGKHVKAEESKIILRVYAKHVGDWNGMMADPEIVKLGYERHTLQHHLDYKKRAAKKPRQRNLRRLMVERTDQPLASAKEDDDDVEEGEEFELVAITARKLGNPTKWYAVFSDGDERWLPENCFIDSDGTVSELFTQFQEDHPKHKDVTYSRKRLAIHSEEEEEELPEPKRRKTTAEAQPLLSQIVYKLAVIQKEQKEILRLISLIRK